MFNNPFTISPVIAFAMPVTDATSIAGDSDDLAFYLYDLSAIGFWSYFQVLKKFYKYLNSPFLMY